MADKIRAVLWVVYAILLIVGIVWLLAGGATL